jgi:hypothetical protein
MESNASSVAGSGGLGRLAAAVEELATEDLTRLADSEAAQRVLVLRRLVDRLEGQWLRELAGVDGRGAAGADNGSHAPSTASWLRGRLRAGGGTCRGWVRTARALFRGPLVGTGRALAAGELSVVHAAALAHATHHLPPTTAAQAEPVLLQTAARLDPPTLRKVVAHLSEVADPHAAQAQAQRLHERRGLWVSPSFEGMVAIDGLLDPEAGQTLLAALDPLARPASADDRNASQRRADALTELARRALEGGRLPTSGGVRPQLTVTIDLASLLGHPGMPGGNAGWVGPLPTETVRRLACDAAVTRVLVTRHHSKDTHGDDVTAGDMATHHHHDHDADPGHPSHHPTQDGPTADHTGDLPALLHAAMALLPPALGGAPTQPWRSAAPPAWSRRPNAPRWRSATAAAATAAATDRSPGATPTTCATGSTAAPPTWPTWYCCAAPTTAPSTKATSGCIPHTDNTPPPPDAAGARGGQPRPVRRSRLRS